MTPTLYIALTAYLAGAVGMILALIHEGQGQVYESTPLTWPWVIVLAVAWPVVAYELLVENEQ